MGLEANPTHPQPPSSQNRLVSQHGYIGGTKWRHTLLEGALSSRSDTITEILDRFRAIVHPTYSEGLGLAFCSPLSLIVRFCF